MHSQVHIYTEKAPTMFELDTSPNEQEHSSEVVSETPQAKGRLRSACDSCHQAKIKCSGGKPCLTCQRSRGRCVYSQGVRLGRPKGRKNKRTLLKNSRNEQTDGPSNSTESTDSKNSLHNTNTDSTFWIEPPGRPAQFEPLSSEFNLCNVFDTSFTDDLVAEYHQDLLIDPNLDKIDLLGSSSVHLSSEDSYVHFDEAANALNDQTEPYCAPSSSTSGHLSRDSGYATGNSGRSVDGSSITSPHSTFNSGNTFNSSISVSTASCSCLQQLAKLLYLLGDLQYVQSDNLAVDSVLQGVRLAQTPWRCLMQCNRCQKNDSQKEAFLLFAMSIRILLSAVQKLDANCRTDTFPCVSLGSFELTGRAKAEVIGVATRMGLRSITSALVHLCERTGRPRPPLLNYPEANDSDSESAIGIFTSTVMKSQRSRGRTSVSGPNTGDESISSLLNTLQHTMKAMEQKP